MITQEFVKNTLDYNPLTGQVFWIKPNKYKIELTGKRAGCFHKQSGYWNIKLKNKTLRLHRVLWFWYYGEWPKGFIDHINHDRSDNRIENLRDVSNRENCSNRKNPNKSGIVGVYPDGNHWYSQTVKEGKYYYLGMFKTKEEAQQKYKEFIN